MTGDLQIPAGAVNGVVWAMGANDGGFSLYVRNGRPVFAGNYLGRTTTRVTSTRPLPQGHVVLRAEFAYDGGGFGRGATLSLYVNDQKVGEARMAATHGNSLGLGGALDIGLDTGAPADEAYQAQMPFPFTATINHVTIQYRPTSAG